MRILVAPQEFKGSLSAGEAAEAIARGVRRALPDVELRTLPMADGGPGTVELIAQALGGRVLGHDATGQLGEAVEARYAIIELPGELSGDTPVATPQRSGTRRVVIEAAATAGLLLLPPERRDPLRATTRGVGEQIRAALDAGASEILVGIGGTGTNDGGAGAATALGYRLLDASGEELAPGGGALRELASIDASGADERLRRVRLRIAVDVRNRLLGPAGATAIFGPQKGVTTRLAPLLEAGLARWAEVVRRDLRVEIAELAGGGAGGGLAAGLVAATGGRIEPGAQLVAEAIGLDKAIRWAELVVTGEGRLDVQTGFGKAVAYVAERCAANERRCVAVAGTVEGLPTHVADAEAAAPPGVEEREAMERASELVAEAAERLLPRALGDTLRRAAGDTVGPVSSSGD